MQFDNGDGDPVTTPSTLTASPYDAGGAGDGGFNALTTPRNPDEISDEDSGSEPCEKQAGSRSDPSVPSSLSERVSDTVKGSEDGDSQNGETGEYTTYVSRSAVYRLLDNVRFVRETVARGDGVLESDAKMWMLAVQIEAEINAILDEGGTR